MRNQQPKTSHHQSNSKFLYYTEKAVQSEIDETLPNRFAKDNDLTSAYFKRHIRLMVHTRLDGIINKLLS